MDHVNQLADSFFDLTLDLLCVAGRDGYLKKVNRRWTEVLGFSEDELCSRPMTEFVHPDDVESTINIRKNFDAGKQIFGFQNRYRCRDGSYRKFEWTAKNEGEFVVAVARDITGRNHEVRMAAMGEIAAEAGHAINNPLMIANFQVERAFKLLKTQMKSDERLNHYYNSYKKASERIAEAVARLRNFAGVEVPGSEGHDIAKFHVESKRILIVEDEAVLAELMKEAIESSQVEVVVAANGAEAVEQLKKGRFDIILTDVSMPVMDGKTMIKTAHQENLLSESTQIIFLTGAVETVFSPEELQHQFFKNCELVAKPISAEKLKVRLKLG